MKVYVVGINIYDEADIIVGIYDSEKQARDVQESLIPYYSEEYGECDVTFMELEMNETYLENRFDYNLLDKYLERSVFEIYEEHGDKYIKFLGYGYESSGDADNGWKDYRILEYLSFEVPLQTVLDNYNCPEDYEAKFGDRYKQYISDVTANELIDSYRCWDNGKAPKELYNLTINTPPGVYVFL